MTKRQYLLTQHENGLLLDRTFNKIVETVSTQGHLLYALLSAHVAKLNEAY